MSILKTRFSRCINVIAKDGMYAGFAGAKTGHGSMPLFSSLFQPRVRSCVLLRSFPPLSRGYLNSVLAIGGEHTMKPRQVNAGFGHQGRQLCDEIQGFEDDVQGRTNAAGAWMR